VIHLATPVALAHLLAEDRRPPERIWDEELIASRLLEYELWNRLQARDLARSHGDAARLMLARVAWVELRTGVLERALHPFPVAVRTLDALHLATMAFLRERAVEPTLATYDRRLSEGAVALGFSVDTL